MPKAIQKRRPYRKYQTGFINKGTTIRKWALSLGLSPASAYDALKGAREGDKAQQIISKAEAFLK